MTDSEIIKALEECIELRFDDDTEYATVRLDTLTNALDLINRQKAEIENLKVENQSLRSAANSLKMHYEKAQANIERLKKYDEERDIRLHARLIANTKSEAYKECLTKVKNYTKTHCNPYGKPDFDYDTSIRILNFINNLVKEMAGENNE